MRRSLTGRVLSCILSVLIVTTVFGSFLPGVDAAVTTKKQKSYDIAIAFDNSGSMFFDQSWCQAKYAMEIFASMLDYDNGDKLTIFPMWEVVTDKSQPKPGPGDSLNENKAPVVIKNKSDIDKISNMHTIWAGTTPFTPVKEAASYLKNSSADEKWMLVLSDGAYDGDIVGDALRQELVDIARENRIKVQYLGFASASEISPDVANGLYTKRSENGASLMSDLVDICNLIFQRSVLPSSYLSGSSLDIDLSMKKVIVFVQGQGARIDSLKSADGKEVAILQQNGQRKFSEISCGKFVKEYAPPVDNTLFGEVVTFDSCAKGKYTLDCPGADNIQIFYEPDVDIKVTLTDSDGNTVDASGGGIEAGEYTITSTMVDGVTGEDVTDHMLMGNDVSFRTYVKTSEDSSPKTYQNGATVTLEPDSETEIVVEGTYLKDYTISTRDDPDAFPLPLVVKELSLDFKATLSSPAEEYKLIDFDSWEPLKVSLTLEGRPLTSDEMSNVSLAVGDSGMPFFCEALPNESAYLIHIGRDQSNNAKLPAVGSYTTSFSFTYNGEYGESFESICNATVDLKCEFDAELTVEQDYSWYTIRHHESWKPLKLKLTLDGEPLTAEQIKNVLPVLTFDKEITYRLEMNVEESCYYIYIGSDESEEFIAPDCGNYDIDVTAKYTDSFGNEFVAEDDESFEVQKYEKFWQWLFWIVVLAVIFILITMFLNHHVYPSNMYFKVRNTCEPIKINGNSVSLSSGLYPGVIKCDAKPCTPFKNRGKTTASIEAKNIKPAGNVEWFEIDGTRFTKSGRGYADSEGVYVAEQKPRIRISDDTELKWKTNQGIVKGTIYINHRD